MSHVHVNGIPHLVNIEENDCEATPYILLYIIDIDDCTGSPCQNNGTCLDAVNSYTCTCIDGYAGTDCLTGRF